MRFEFSTLFVVLLTLFSVPSRADTAGAGILDESEIYERCYMRLVRLPMPETDDLFAKVQAKTLTGAAACSALLKTAVFKASTGAVANANDDRALEIVRSLHAFHRSFFESKTLTNADTKTAQTTALVKDVEEPALYFTRAALLENEKFSSVVTLGTGLRGLRHRPNTASVNNFEANSILPNFVPGYPYAKKPDQLPIAFFTSNNKVDAIIYPDTKIMQSGLLYGVAAAIPMNFGLAKNLQVNSSPVAEQSELTSAFQDQASNQDMNQHFGGGVLGSQIFFIENAGVTINIPQSGESLINRRLSSHVYQDLLCHELPTLTADDVAGDVQTTSPFPFRQNKACMQCHSSLDTLANGYRHMVMLRSATLPNPKGQDLGLPIINVFGFQPVSGAKAFDLQTPAGQLHYRELITSAVVNKPFTSLAGAGAVLAAQNDIYTCAAKRYYYFLTGVNVALRPLDKTADSYAIDKLHQDYVIALGKKLKTTQSVLAVFDDVFQSNIFRTRNHKDSVSVEVTQ